MTLNRLITITSLLLLAACGGKEDEGSPAPSASGCAAHEDMSGCFEEPGCTWDYERNLCRTSEG